MLRLFSSIVLIITILCVSSPNAQICPSGCTCRKETTIGKLSVSCDTSNQSPGTHYIPFPIILPNNTRVFYFRSTTENNAFKESDVSFADISWAQVEEITLQSVDHFNLNETRLIGLPKLRVLRMINDTLRDILYPVAFRLTPNLEVLDLSYNPWLSLKSVVEALNDSLPNLKYLDLCNLQNALNEPFILNKEFAKAIEHKPLISLNVSNTKISLFDDGLTSESIRYLNLSHTSGLWWVRYMNPNLCPNIEEIDLSHTGYYVPKYTFIQLRGPFSQNLTCIRFLSSAKRFVANNLLMSNPIYLYDYRLRFWCITIAMEELYMRYSNIRWLNVTLNITLFNLKIVDLEGNSMEYLSPEGMKKAPNLRKIYLSRNLLSSMLNLRNLFEGNAKLEVIDLSQNRLSFIPWSMFDTTPNVSILRLQGNLLSICDFSIEKLTKLTLLDLSDNMIKYISKDTLSGLVFIFNEQIRYWNNILDTNVSNIKEDNALYLTNNSVILSKSLTMQLAINLTGNLMECTCDRIWFNEWILVTNIQLFNKHLMKCKFETDYNYMSHEFWNDLKYRCKLKDYVPIIIAIPCSILIMFAFIYAIVRKKQRFKRRRKNKRALMVRYKMNENEDRQRYFVFLSYAGTDDELVSNYIYPALEIVLRETFGNIGNLICTGDTHFTPGRWVADEIDHYLNRCDVIVMVVSKHFIESEWCKYEVMLAKQKNKLKILLVNEAVYQEKIPSALKDILQFCTRATWTLQNGNFFIRPDWNKICEGIVGACIRTVDEVEEETKL